MPFIYDEGIFLKPIPSINRVEENKKLCKSWETDLQTFERLHAHQTLSSARRYAHFHCYRDTVPSDSLDIALSAKYNHEQELFPDKTDYFYQAETLGEKTWRRLRNTIDVPKKPPEFIKFNENAIGGGISVPTCIRRIKVPVMPYRYNPEHKVMITGITEKRDPNNVKLMNSSHHSSLTNPGFSRQSLDGNIYQY
ncbi:uncharacterized protein LOC126265553 [Aethina tumida]|uniref:uncharacterized protein LOC126265553 n=1 Tax=Aethina tumida TaxID=116153 RepID=UPI002147F1C9|nr:uncharacterized protein LOC126265553 [Aethina tumida]